MAKPKEEPKKEEVKRTKVKVPKAKKYEDLPEIPDYERPELEVYEESEFDPSKLEKSVETPLKQAETPVEIKLQEAELPKNGLPKVSQSVSVAFSFPHSLGVFLFPAFICTDFIFMYVLYINGKNYFSFGLHKNDNPYKHTNTECEERGSTSRSRVQKRSHSG